MYKLFNFKCKNCGHSEEDLLDTNKKISKTRKCPKCDDKMEIFNFKDNCGRWRYVDTVRGD